MKLRELFVARDMTEGTPWKRIMEFTIPLLIGNVAQQFYNTADSVVVGRYIGDNALAAVGSAGPVLNLLLALFIGISTGAGILVAQYYGAKDRGKLSSTIGTCLSLTGIVSIITMVIGPMISRPLLIHLKTPDSILDWCDDYLKIYFIGIAGNTFYNISAGILRGLGDSVSALIFLLVSTVLNIWLDIWFVASFGMGVPGVALATVIAQGISAILCLIKLYKMNDVFDFKAKYLIPLKEYSLKLIKLGLPSGLTQMVFAMASIVVQSLTNSLGELVIACNVIVMRVDGFAMMPNFSFGNAMTTYAGQNIGAKKLERVHEGTKSGLKMGVGIAIVLTLILLLFGRYIMGIFTDTIELVDLSYRMMCILAVGYIAMAVTQVLSGIMRGAGDTMTPMWISFITTIGLRVPIAYGIAHLTKSAAYPNGRPESIFVSTLIAWVLGAVINIFAFKKGKWREKAIADFKIEGDVLVEPSEDVSVDVQGYGSDIDL